jgi:Domain of unknown function (DUF4114)/FG-GAP-like repeat
MGLFSSNRRRSSAKGFQPKPKSEVAQPEPMILEQMLTPSGLTDGTDDTPDPGWIDPNHSAIAQFTVPLTENGLFVSPMVTDSEPAIAIEPVSFVFDAPSPDLVVNWEDLPQAEIPGGQAQSFTFVSGFFEVDPDGEGRVSIDYLHDGGSYRGELAIVALDGMEHLKPGSPEFIQEAARRALSDSTLGHVVIQDAWESNYNRGEYLGAKFVQMEAGSQFFVMFVPNGTVQQVFDQPEIGGDKRPLFSLATANPIAGMQLGQIGDVTGDGHTFAMEDQRIDKRSDRDYNDIIFNVKGAIGSAPMLDNLINAQRDWRDTEIGQKLIDFVKPVEVSVTTPPIDTTVETPLLDPVSPIFPNPEIVNILPIADPPSSETEIFPESDPVVPVEAEIPPTLAPEGVTNPASDDLIQVFDNQSFTFNGRPDNSTQTHATVVWRSYTTGETEAWWLNPTERSNPNNPNTPNTDPNGFNFHDRIDRVTILPQVTDLDWQIRAAGDVDGDGDGDLLWRNLRTGQNVVWTMQGSNLVSAAFLPTVPDAAWQIVTAGDFNRDGGLDIVWRNSQTGQNAIWYLDPTGQQVQNYSFLLTVPDPNWQIHGSGDFNRDASLDLVWRNRVTGETALWLMGGEQGNQFQERVALFTVADPAWQIQGAGDFDRDGDPDILWRNAMTGQVVEWIMAGTQYERGRWQPAVSPSQNWQATVPFMVVEKRPKVELRLQQDTGNPTDRMTPTAFTAITIPHVTETDSHLDSACQYCRRRG